jgi:2-polyprenyl-3-methyl-5-hydroxy-6-metoxy-1,4-benzoquinol methylase
MNAMVRTVAVKEVEFHSLSYEDGSGRLFWRDGRLFRGLSADLAPSYEKLFQDGVIGELVNDGLLVESRLTGDAMEAYPAIVEHSVVPFVSFAHEWCPEMLRSAGRLVLDLAARLDSRGLHLADGHAWNVLFQGPRPVFVDLGAIRPGFDTTEWSAAGAFRHHFLNPLYLASGSGEGIARALMQVDYNGGVSASYVPFFNPREKLVVRTRARAARLAGRVLPKFVQEMLRKKLPRHPSGGSPAAHIESLRKDLDSIPLAHPETRWSGYYDGNYPPFEPDEQWTPKHRALAEILARIRPASVLDVGANRGWYALASAKRGALVVALDTDSECIHRLYSDALAQSLPVLPLIMDFRSPSPARGLCGEIVPAAWDRLRCDLVLALAVVHHLALAQRLTFDHIVRSLKRFAKRHLLVEFPKRDDYMAASLLRAGDDWYSSENFENTLRRYSMRVERLPSESDTREIYFCELE